jgi:monovalent cation:H+ antiporter-2, CPA2 family
MADPLTITPALSDALTILGAAGIVIPAFARLRINPVLGFIIVGILAGPHVLGGMAARHPWLEAFSITDPGNVETFGEFGIILLLFSIGLELSFRRLAAMRRTIFGLGAAELFGCAMLIGGALVVMGNSPATATVLGLALAMSSTALVLPIAGTRSPVGRAAFAMLLFEDIALVPLLFLFGTLGGGSSIADLTRVAWQGALTIVALLVAGRLVLPRLFAQAARTKSPELFLSISLLAVLLSAMATAAVRLSALLGALLAGILIAETEYRGEVEVVTAPFRGLALGVFLITVGMHLDLPMLAAEWPRLLTALLLVLAIKAVVTAFLLRAAGTHRGVAAETGVLMASPSETTLILLGAGAAAGVIRGDAASFWQAVTALGLTITPLLALLGRQFGRRVDAGITTSDPQEAPGRTLIGGVGRVGQLVADMLVAHDRAYLAIDGDIDAVAAARAGGYRAVYGDIAKGDPVERFGLRQAAALVLTMDDPVLTVRITAAVRAACPDLTIVARARDAVHAAQLYRAGATDAVPETLEGSLQMSEAVLVDIGVAMGPVIASIHEKRSDLRAAIMAAGELAHEPMLGRRR